jgi:MFS family permease
MAFHLGYISGPSVAGALIDTLGWRWIFFLNLPVALAAAFMALKVLPETAIQRETHSLDLMGMVTLFSMAVTIILGLQQIAKTGVTWVAITIFIISAVSAGLLLHFERKSPAPLLDLSLFKIRVLTAGSFEPSLCSDLAQFDILPITVLPAGDLAFYSDPGRHHGHLLFFGDRVFWCHLADGWATA